MEWFKAGNGRLGGSKSCSLRLDRSFVPIASSNRLLECRIQQMASPYRNLRARWGKKGTMVTM